MSVVVIDTIAPKNAGSWSVCEDKYLMGGWQTAATLIERDAIPTQRRKVGMRVRVPGLSKTYELVGGVDNANWFEVIDGTVTVPDDKAHEDFTITVNPVTGASPPADTTVRTQAEADAVGPVKYVQEALDICPRDIYGHVILIQLADGNHLAKVGASGSPWMDQALNFRKFFFNTATAESAYNPTYWWIFNPGIVIMGPNNAVVDAEQAGTVAGTIATRAAGTWTPGAMIGNFIEFKTGVNAGTRLPIEGNDTTTLTIIGDALIGGACTFEINAPASIILDSTDGVNQDTYGLYIDGFSNMQVTWSNVQFGTHVLPFSNIILYGTVGEQYWLWCKVHYKGYFNINNNPWQPSLYWDSIEAVNASSGINVTLNGFVTLGNTLIFGIGGSQLLGTTINGTLEMSSCTVKALAGHTDSILWIDGGFANIRGTNRLVGNGSCPGFTARYHGTPPHVHNGSFSIKDCTPNVKILNTTMVINGSFLGGGVSGTAAVGWEVNGSKLMFAGAYNVAGGTTNIMLDGAVHTYAELAGAGDEIVSLAGSSMLRTA